MAKHQVAVVQAGSLLFDTPGTLDRMPTAGERLIWGMGDGSTRPVLDTEIGKLAAAICWENYMPALRMTLYSKGVSLWCAPTVDDRAPRITIASKGALRIRSSSGVAA